MHEHLFSVAVECYAGYRGEETAVRFRLGDHFVEVAEVLDRWLAPDHQYFKVKTADGTYILGNDIASSKWGIDVVRARRRSRSIRPGR